MIEKALGDEMKKLQSCMSKMTSALNELSNSLQNNGAVDHVSELSNSLKNKGAGYVVDRVVDHVSSIAKLPTPTFANLTSRGDMASDDVKQGRLNGVIPPVKEEERAADDLEERLSKLEEPPRFANLDFY